METPFTAVEKGKTKLLKQTFSIKKAGMLVLFFALLAQLALLVVNEGEAVEFYYKKS